MFHVHFLYINNTLHHTKSDLVVTIKVLFSHENRSSGNRVKVFNYNNYTKLRGYMHFNHT